MAVKMAALTKPMTQTLLGAYIWGSSPISFQSSSRELQSLGLLKSDAIGNLILTSEGLKLAKHIWLKVSTRIKSRKVR